jgi:hypothetical protein
MTVEETNGVEGGGVDSGGEETDGDLEFWGKMK